MRRVALVGLLCVACTRPNPAFDERPLADDGTGEQGDGDGDGDGDPSTTVGTDDVPPEPPACEWQPSEGLSLHVGGPENYGGVCAPSVTASGTLVSANGSELVLESCTPGCVQCFDTTLTISTYPLSLDGHIPPPQGQCLEIEASSPISEEANACYFGALTIYVPNPLVPYVIATTHSHAPTPMGAAMLGGSIPAPKKAGNCNCDDVGQGNDCCYAAPSPPEFWYYPIEGAQLFPGDYAPLTVPNVFGITHLLKLFQAQLLHSCESHDLQLSWAIVAEL